MAYSKKQLKEIMKKAMDKINTYSNIHRKAEALLGAKEYLADKDDNVFDSKDLELKELVKSKEI